MESSKEPITVRVGKLNSQIIGKTKTFHPIFNREGLLDALQVLYDECDSDCLRNLDKNIANFVDDNKKFITDVKRARVNITDFELKNVIGRGHFGEVHLVKEKQTGDVYAMKIIKKHLSLEERNVAFNEERNIMAFSDSSWITSLQYAFQDSASLYFVMEYHPGGDLLGLLYRQGGTLPESAACFYLAELIMAINDLHQMGFVHRDIKPDNVLLDRCGHIKLADFGSAAKLTNGILCNPVPVGTPDYIAPEVLQSMNGKTQKASSYGASCDYWSLGILAYELVVGNTPFNGNNTSTVYAKIMSHSQHLKFPSDIILSQGYVVLVKALITDHAKRLVYPKILDHVIFKVVDFNSLRDQVPPYVPKISSIDDTSNFSDVQVKKNQPNIENFKKKTQFSGRNLPFIGFTFTQDMNGYKERYPTTNIRDSVLDNMKTEMDNLQKKLMKCNDWQQEKHTLEKNMDNANRKLNSIEGVRYNLEKDIAKYLAEISALKRTLEIERKDRSELERQALELIKSAKLKWEASEKHKLDAINCELEQQKEQNQQLAEENRSLKEEVKLCKQLENTHKVSLEKVEQINRKSVIGLETRLETVALNSRSQIVKLQEEIKREKSEYKILEEKLNVLIVHKVEFDKKLQTEQQTNRKLEIEVAELSTRNKQLKEQIIQANNDMMMLRSRNVNLDGKLSVLNKEVIELKHDKKAIENILSQEKVYSAKFKQEVEKLNLDVTNQKKKVEQILLISSKDQEDNIVKLQEEIKLLNDRNMSLELKLQEARQNEEENLQKVQGLEQLLNRLESGITKLENSSEREDVLQDQIQRLEQQLIEVRETNTLEKQELLKFKTTLWRCEKELSNSNLDKKIVERDLKDAQNENKKLTEEVNNLKEQFTNVKKQNQDALIELSGMNESMANEILKLKELNNQLHNEMSSKAEKQDQDQVVIGQFKEMTHAKETCINQLKLQLESLKKEKNDLLVILERKDYEINDTLDNLSKVNEARKLEIIARENYKIDLEKAIENIHNLKEACEILDNQLAEFEKLKVECDAKETTANYKIEQLTVETDQLKQKLSDVKKFANEEKSLKFMAESKHKRLLEEKESLENNLKVYRSQRDEFKEYANNLSEELRLVEEKLAESETIIVSKERTIDNYLAEKKMLKEEISSHLTHMSNLKETIFNLNQSLSDLKRDHDVLLEKFQELENAYYDKVNYSMEREVKFNSTIQQQTKLIDFLQLKVEEAQKKKKTLSDKLFGQSKKENVAPLSMNYKDLENELKKEKQINTDLRDELYKLKNYSLPDCLKQNKLFKEDKKILEQIVQSPNIQKNDLPRQKSLQRMRHKIPHRFESKMSTRLSKCAHCDNHMYLGKTVNVCQECHITVHGSCASLVPKTCGLPNAFAQHFSNSIRKTNASSTEAVSTENDTVNVEGWLKILDKETHSWAKRYVCLVGSWFKIYTNKPSDELDLIEEVDLLPNNGHAKIILEPSPSEIDVPVASSDLTFILKVEIHFDSTCWPPQCLVFMTLTLDDKEKWFKALENCLKEAQKYNGKELLLIKDNIDVNCITDILEHTILLGTDKGLFTYFNNNLVHINGFTSVHQISLITNINMAIMIVNTNRILIKCDLNHLKDVAQCAPCTNPSLNYSIINVNNLNGFHIFETSMENKQLILGVATNKKVIVLIYERNELTFKPLRILDTAEPSSCLLFTEHSLIIGADKFFEVDLITYEADELLDASDHKLSHAVMCSKLGSFPLAIIRISKNPLEYLVCFKEFASFIDEYGRSTRESDLKWSQLPVAFHFHSSYLYVVTYLSIEIIKISCDKDTCHETIFKANYNNLRYLGYTKNGIYLKIGDGIKLIEAKGIDTSDSSSFTTSNDDENREEDRFSFTSSMVNSLDGNLSDDEINVCHKFETKRVQFTDL